MRNPSPARIESNLRKLNNTNIRRMSKARNRRDSKKRGTAKLHAALLRPTDPDKLFIKELDNLLRNSRRTLDFIVRHTARKKKKMRIVEYYIQHASTPNFLPKKEIAKHVTHDYITMFLSKISSLGFVFNQTGKYRKIVHVDNQNLLYKGKHCRVDSTFGFVPANNLFNNASPKELLESMPRGYFIFREERYEKIKGVEKGYRLATTRVTISPTFLWLKLSIDLKKARSERFAKIVGNLAPYVFAQKVPVKVIKLFDREL